MGSAGASMGCFGKFVAAALLGAGLTGCASGGHDAAVYTAGALPRERGHAESAPGQTPLQCVPYAREHSQVKIMGDAYTWWAQAAGHYAREKSPSLGSVMVLHGYAGPKHGHLAVVRKVVNSREIRVDHANWLNEGSIFLNDPVADVSPDNDWSQVRVWNIPNNAWGSRIYPVSGFIAAPGSSSLVARGGAMAKASFAPE